MRNEKLQQIIKIFLNFVGIRLNKIILKNFSGLFISIRPSFSTE